MFFLGRPYHFIFFKGCLPQILLGSFLNTLTHMKKQYHSHKTKSLFMSVMSFNLDRCFFSVTCQQTFISSNPTMQRLENDVRYLQS